MTLGPHAGRKRRSLHPADLIARECAYCQREYNYTYYKEVCDFRVSKFCSHDCYMAFRRSVDPIARFWEKVKIGGPDECWPWQAATGPKGYGVFGTGGAKATKLAHVYAYELKNGPVPKGLCVCHSCDNPPCVNDTHHFLGTRADNNADMRRKGRHARGETNGHAKLTSAIILEIRAAFAAGERNGILAKRYGLTSSRITRIVHRTEWSHLP